MYPWVKGGAEKRIADIAPLIAAGGIEVHLYGMKFWDGPNTFSKGGVTYHALCPAMPLYIKSGRRSIVQALVFGIACLRLAIERVDLIDCQAFPFFSVFACGVVARLRRIPLVVTWHEVWGDSYWSRYLGRLGAIGAFVEGVVAKFGVRRICVSELTSSRLIRDLNGAPTSIAVIPTGVDVARIKAARPEGRPADVIYVGRLVDFKNVDILIHAIEELRNRGGDLSLAIVGDGPAAAFLQSLTAKLGLDDRVEFRGWVAGDVYGHMKSAGVLVLPSSREGFGLVVIEAYACGVPVVTVDEPDNAASFLVGSERGRVTPLDAHALADAIAEVVRARTAMHDACLQFAERHDVTNCAGMTADVYRDALIGQKKLGL